MTASRTTEGSPFECPVCGKGTWTDPSAPAGDTVCPHCGHIMWPNGTANDAARLLADRGVVVETDDEGEVSKITLAGATYDDTAVEQLAKLRIPVIDVQGTAMTLAGVQRLRTLLPESTVEF